MRCRQQLMAVRAGLQPATQCSRNKRHHLISLVLQKSFVQVLERAKGRDAPGGGILDVVARQPYLLRRAEITVPLFFLPQFEGAGAAVRL